MAGGKSREIPPDPQILSEAYVYLHPPTFLVINTKWTNINMYSFEEQRNFIALKNQLFQLSSKAPRWKDKLDLTFVFLDACATQHQTLAIAFFPEKIPCTFFFTFFLQSTSQLSTVIVLVLKYREVILLPQILKWQSVNNDYRAVRLEVKCHLTILNSLSSKSRHLAKCCVTE